MRGARLSIDLLPKQEMVPLDALVEALGRFREMLTSLNPRGAELLTWKVTDLGLGSVHATVEAVGNPEVSAAVVDLALRGLDALERTAVPPEEFRPALEPARNLAALAEKLDMRLVVSGLNVKHELGSKIREAADVFLKEEEWEAWGSVEGYLQMVSLRSGPLCNIYDGLTDHRIECRYPSEMLNQIKEALGKRVLATGNLRHDRRGNVRSIRIRTLLTLPEDGETPSIQTTAGIAPGITGNLSVTEYIRRLRDEQ
jgi:hypothetical protein